MWVWFVVAFMYLIHLLSRSLQAFAFVDHPLPSGIIFIDVFTSVAIFISLFLLYVLALSMRCSKKIASEASDKSLGMTKYLMVYFGSLIKLAACFVLLVIVGGGFALAGVLPVFKFTLLMIGTYLVFVAFTAVFSLRIVKKIHSGAS